MYTWKILRMISLLIGIGTIIAVFIYGYFYMSDGVVDNEDVKFLIPAMILAAISMFSLSIDMSTDGGKNTSKKAIMAGISFAMFMLIWRVLASIL
jgi:hypothetical protein